MKIISTVISVIANISQILALSPPESTALLGRFESDVDYAKART